MKTVRYFFAEDGQLCPIDESNELIQKVRWHKDETLKVEIWPFDLKIGPCTQIPYGKRRQKFATTLEQFINRPEEERKRPYQKTILWLDQARTPYSEEFTKRDVARNRAYLSPKVPKRRRGSKNTSTQDDAPF